LARDVKASSRVARFFAFEFGVMDPKVALRRAAGSTVISSMQVSASILQRKGSVNTAGVPREVLELLNAGQIETVNLSEWLAVDLLALAGAVFPVIGREVLLPSACLAVAAIEGTSAPKRSAAIVGVLHDSLDGAERSLEVAQALGQHRSDVVRGWACSLIGLEAGLTLEQKLSAVRPLAADSNMSVREMAWLALRPSIAAELDSALELLRTWVLDGDPNVRRFASEATRPRGVWCSHIGRLKEQPGIGLALLKPLNSDPSKYVRDSVANWLNDASKSQPQWVRQICEAWKTESSTKETAYIVKRALRTLEKAVG
jgi:3-methyladenine DNA glycosylase AlkC